MRKISIFVGMILFFGTSFCLAQEQITLTTYYPSPYGVYDGLLTNRLGVGDNDGDGNLTSADVPTTPGDVWIDGNVGIGTTSPGRRLVLGNGTEDEEYLSINGNFISGLLFEDSGSIKWSIYYDSTVGPDGYLTIYDQDPTGGIGHRFTIDQSGNVGIGTTAPARKLSIGEPAGASLLLDREDTTTVLNNLLGQILFDSTDGDISTNDASAMIRAYASESHGVGDKGGYLTFETKVTNTDSNQSATEHMRITDAGNVGIGTTSPGTYRLYVNGNMYVNGDITTDSATYPDYVFGSGYKLITLKELKKFIKENKHLPGMPSARKVKEEGVKIFEQNRLILEKLEEAYLYIIELQERIEDLEVTVACNSR